MRLLRTTALAPLLLALALPVCAQTAEEEVRAVIDQLFDGMRAGDSTMVAAVFHPQARLVSTFTRDGVPSLRETPISRFVTAVGTPHDAVWDERIWDVEIDVDDNLASAWMQFAFYAGDQFSHCGVNHFTFARTPAGWQAIHLADTRRMGDACDLP